MDKAQENPRAYIEALLDILQQHSLKRDEVDWKAFREELLAQTAEARSISDTYPAIENAIKKLHDGHSMFLSPVTVNSWTHDSRPPLPEGKRIGSVAYLNVPWFVPNDEMSSTAYVDDLHKLIASLDTGNVTGWVLDLRENTGGNSWPMLAGLGPLLDEGLLGFYRSLDEPEIPWGYKDGAAWGYNMTQASGSGAPYRLKDTSKPRLAVLTGKNTASAGELLSVVLKGLPHARSFGAETSGQATVNERFELPDGSIMFLATGCFADRTGKNYPSKIAPDEKIENSGTSEDLVLNRALSWIKKPGPVSAAKPRVLKPL